MSNELSETKNGFMIEPKTFTEAQEYARFIAASDFIPKEFKGQPANVLVACQMGAELGLKPLQSLQNIAVINGKPVVWGDAMVAIVRSRSDCESIVETFDVESMTATCTIKRKNQPPESRTFSREDATTAKLWGNNTWGKYPKRMLQMRARAFALRDVFGDALKGFQIAEEVQDYEVKVIDTTSEVGSPSVGEPEIKMYPEDDFNNNFEAWETLIKSGKKSSEAIIKTIKSKGELSLEQIAKIKAVNVQEPIDGEVVDNENS